MQSSQQWRIQTLRKGWGERGGGGHPDPEIRGGPVSKKNFFSHFGPQFGLKIRPLPWICHWSNAKLKVDSTTGFV